MDFFSKPQLETSKFLNGNDLGEVKIASMLSPPRTFILPSLQQERPKHLKQKQKQIERGPKFKIESKS